MNCATRYRTKYWRQRAYNAWLFGALLACLVYIFIGCGAPQSYDLTGFESYIPEELDTWKQRLNEYYKTDLKSINDLKWYVGPVERECDDHAGCTNSMNDVLLDPDNSETCSSGLHEMMHHALDELYGDMDASHLRKDWKDVTWICYRVTIIY